ncbi:MAG TPA: ATP-binding cassette domain-containing protein, partial [Phycisphaerae bacterium]|nr:ATP-binding cassette domain-containing protein [Phycisphaerae bacterium]
MNDKATANAAGISARALVKHYEAGRVRAVDGLDLEIAGGEFVAICGPSGCGKTTLLNLIAAIDRPDAGSLSVAGVSLTRLSGYAADGHRRSTIGLVFQMHNLLPNLTALENVQVPMLVTRRAPRERRARARALLERVGLSHREHALPNALSAGERQRV